MFGHPAQDLGSRLVGDELAASGAEAALLQEHLEFDEQSDQLFFVFFFHFQFSIDVTLLCITSLNQRGLWLDLRA